MSIGKHEPNEFWATLSETAEPQEHHGGTVRLTSHIKYGQGFGIRFIDMTVEQAERLGVELIQAAQQANDQAEAKRIRDAKVRADLDAAIARQAQA